ncbi:MAG TPA: DUF5317 domain-containing protein [bacterium]|nr:DUF5317 domain-containing protein [bacterium]
MAGLVGLAAGWIRGGRFNRLAGVSLRWFPVLVFGVILVFASQLAWLPDPAPRLLVGAGYLAAVAMLAANRDRPWLVVVLAGAVLNAVVIVANEGRMPVSPGALAMAGRPASGALIAGTDPRHVLETPWTPLGFLDDRVAFHIAGLAGILSPGDVLMAVGAAGFVQAAMGETRRI